MADTFISAWSFCWEPVEIFPISCKMIMNLIVLNKKNPNAREAYRAWICNKILHIVCQKYLSDREDWIPSLVA